MLEHQIIGFKTEMTAHISHHYIGEPFAYSGVSILSSDNAVVHPMLFAEYRKIFLL